MNDTKFNELERELEAIMPSDVSSFPSANELHGLASAYGVDDHKIVQMAADIKSKMASEKMEDAKEEMKYALDQAEDGISFPELYDYMTNHGYEIGDLSKDEWRELHDSLTKDPDQLKFFQELRQEIRKTLLEEFDSFDFSDQERPYYDKAGYEQGLELNSAQLEDYLNKNGIVGIKDDVISIMDGMPNQKVKDAVEEYQQINAQEQGIEDMSPMQMMDKYLQWAGLETHTNAIMGFLA